MKISSLFILKTPIFVFYRLISKRIILCFKNVDFFLKFPNWEFSPLFKNWGILMRKVSKFGFFLYLFFYFFVILSFIHYRFIQLFYSLIFYCLFILSIFFISVILIIHSNYYLIILRG